MANFNITLNGPIQVFDLNNNLVTSKTLTGLTVSVLDYTSGSIAFSAAATAITLPVSPTNFMYLRNDGTAVAVVSWIPQGGSGAIVQNLGISSAAAIIQVGQGGTTGITGLTVSCAASTTVEYFLAG
jgi:hypothetical protein